MTFFDDWLWTSDGLTRLLEVDDLSVKVVDNIMEEEDEAHREAISGKEEDLP